MDIPQQVLEMLRCSQCNEYLSKFPIYTYSNGASVCGRCTLEEDYEPRRSFVYEQLAAQAKFPCPNQDCNERMSPDALLVHESSCGCRSYPCPICDWKGTTEELQIHFVLNHSGFVLHLSGTFEINVDEPSEIFRMIKGELGEMFIVRTIVKGSQFSIAVMYAGLKNACCYNWSFSLYSNNLNDGLEFPKNRIDWYGDSCALKNIFHTEIDTLKSLQTGFVKCQIFITRDDDVAPPQQEPMEALNRFILNKLECPVCFETMYPPIFQCSNSHIICESCKKEYSNCPTCAIPLGEIRNRFVEEIADALQYTCRHEGCDVTYMLRDKKQHEGVCTFVPYTCTCGCPWQGNFNQLIQHLRTEHHENVLEFGTVAAYFDEDPDMYAIIKSNALFRVAQKSVDQNLLLAVQYWGPRGADAINYDFTVNMENKTTHERLFVKRKCSPAATVEETFATDGDFIEVPVNLLKPFMEDIHLNYTIDIFPHLLLPQ